MEAIIFCIIIGLIVALALIGVGICIGRSMNNDEKEETEEEINAEVLVAKLRAMAITLGSSEERKIIKDAADYIEKGNEKCAS